MKHCKRCGKPLTALRDETEGSVHIWLLDNDEEICTMKCSCGGRSDPLSLEEQNETWPARYVLFDLRKAARA